MKDLQGAYGTQQIMHHAGRPMGADTGIVQLQIVDKKMKIRNCLPIIKVYF
ncbi:MAG: hypothetical protein AB8B47_03885 [Roseobacter sp.]